MRKFLQSSDALAKKLNELEKETQKKFAKQQEEIKGISKNYYLKNRTQINWIKTDFRRLVFEVIRDTLKLIFDAIKELMIEKEKPERKIGL